MSSKRLTFVVHPSDLNKLQLSDEAEVQLIEATGPLGFNRYTGVKAEVDKDRIRELNAIPFYLSLPEEVIRYYNENYFLETFKMLLERRIGAKPDSFQIFRFEELRARHYYPQYIGQYLYVGPSETRLLNINPLSLLGVYPVSGDSDVWKVLRVNNAIDLEGACVIKTDKLDAVQMEQIQLTQSELDYTKLTTPVLAATSEVCYR